MKAESWSSIGIVIYVLALWFYLIPLTESPDAKVKWVQGKIIDRHIIGEDYRLVVDYDGKRMILNVDKYEYSASSSYHVFNLNSMEGKYVAWMVLLLALFGITIAVNTVSYINKYKRESREQYWYSHDYHSLWFVKLFGKGTESQKRFIASIKK